MFGINSNHNNDNLKLEAFGYTEVGHKRLSNEDAFLIGETLDSAKILAIADAFTSECGEESSRLAVSELHELMFTPSSEDVKHRMKSAFNTISQDIEEHFRRIHHAPSIGTTLSAVLVEGDAAYLAHVGNTRVYLVRNGQAHLLTSDDTYAQVLVNSGIEPSESSKKTLLQALGVKCELEPNLLEIKLMPDDYLILCSDGLSNNLTGTEIIETIKANPSLEVAVERMIEMADERDGKDNITVVLARVYQQAKDWLKYPNLFSIPAFEE